MGSNLPDAPDPRGAALDLLRTHRVAVVATTDGLQPWASTVYYADDGFTLYVNTPNGTTMLRNLRQNPRVGYAVDEQRPTFFLQGIGWATVVEDSGEFERARSLLAVKVPEAHVGHPGYTLVKIASRVVYVSDFRQGYRPRATIVVADERGAAGGDLR